MKFKDESNRRIIKAIEDIGKVMEEEGRGFIFAPIVQLTGNHKTMCAITFAKEDEGGIGLMEFVQFWATLGSIIDNFNKQLSEDQRREFREGFIPFCELVAEQCFPKIKLYNVRKKL